MESGKNDYQYMIFCKKKNNPMAEDAAKDVSIPYHKTFNSLVEHIMNYFHV